MEWQKDLWHDWKDMSHPNKVRNVDRELQELYKWGKTKGQAERLANICADATRPHGSYVMDVEKWTCSCPSFVISCFLICKHLVQIVNS